MTTGPSDRVKVHPQTRVKGQRVQRGMCSRDPQEVSGAEVGQYCEDDLGGQSEERRGVMLVGGTAKERRGGGGGSAGRGGVLLCRDIHD